MLHYILKSGKEYIMLNEEIIRKSIGAKLKARRKNKGYTQNYVAEVVDMDEKQLSRLEAGKHFPTLKTLLSLTNFLEMNLADFDDYQNLYDKNYYELTDILKKATAKEIKQYLTIIKAIKTLTVAS